MYDLFFEVFGDEAEDFIQDNEKDVGGDYGSLEKDEMEYIEEEGDGEDMDDLDMDYDGGGE